MLKRALLSLIILYLVLLGGTYNGILTGSNRLITVLLMGAAVIAWLWMRRGWRWHRTALDGAILLWCAAFAISLAGNLDQWRRIAIGLYFMGIYIGAWYVLEDLLANHALRREWLIDGLLIAGAPVVFFGYAQVYSALLNGAALPRPVSILGNANALAALLVLLIPFILGRLMTARAPLARVSLSIYGVSVLGLIGLSFSRGGWIGAAAALAVWVILTPSLRRLWSRLPHLIQWALAGCGVLALLVGLYVIVESLGISGRSIDVRMWIYETAIQTFREQPLTGSGLFSFGADLARLNSLPPSEPHSHAHNLILHVAAEMGIVGLAALLLTAWMVLRSLRRERDPITVMGAAALAGFVVHQMFDLPAMMPTIALVALIALALMLPAEGEPIRGRWQPALLGIGGLALTLAGLWSAFTYSGYLSVVSSGANGDYNAAAEQLQPFIDGDPSLAIYPKQQGMLFALAAAAGDPQAAQSAADDFERYTQLEPSYASGWANLAAMEQALGQSDAALAAMREAAALAPRSWSILYRYGNYAEALGDDAAAQQAYQQAVGLGADIILIPDWDQSPLRRAISVDESQLTPLAQTLVLLERGEIAAAQAKWASEPHLDDARDHAMSMLIALSAGDQSRAEAEFEQARRLVTNIGDQAWADLCEGLIHPANLDQALDAARQVAYGDGYAVDWELGANIDYVQYLSLSIPRQFVPQVGYSEIDQALLHLLGDADALAKLRAALGD